MYRVMIKACGNKAAFSPVSFDFADPGADGARAQLNALADCLYDLDLDFDVDMDGDMLIDDILMQVSEAEEFEEILGDGKRQYVITGKLQKNA